MTDARLVLPDADRLRALVSGRKANRQRGWQCHHVLPRGLARHRQIAEWLVSIEGLGPALAARRENTLWLPSIEAVAIATGMALHRGPHPAYNTLVAARLERIRASGLDAGEARVRVGRLQRALAASLSGSAPAALWLNRHDPMRLFADYSSLDEAIAALL